MGLTLSNMSIPESSFPLWLIKSQNSFWVLEPLLHKIAFIFFFCLKKSAKNCFLSSMDTAFIFFRKSATRADTATSTPRREVLKDFLSLSRLLIFLLRGVLYAFPPQSPEEVDLPIAWSSDVRKLPFAELGGLEKKSTERARRFSSIDMKLDQLLIAFLR